MYAILTSSDNKTWNMSSIENSLSAVRNGLINNCEGKVRDGDFVMIVKINNSYKASLKPDICQNCDKPYEYEGNLVLVPE